MIAVRLPPSGPDAVQELNILSNIKFDPIPVKQGPRDVIVGTPVQTKSRELHNLAIHGEDDDLMLQLFALFDSEGIDEARDLKISSAAYASCTKFK